MNDKFNEQKEYLISIKQEIKLLYQQVDYLIRNEKELGLLDLDVLMNRTHTLYDRLCAIQVGDTSIDDEDLDLDPSMFEGLFGGVPQETSVETDAEIEKEPEQQSEEEPAVEDSTEDFGFIFKVEDETPVEEEKIPEEEDTTPVEEENNPEDEDTTVIEEDGRIVHFIKEIPEEEYAEGRTFNDEIPVEDTFELVHSEEDTIVSEKETVSYTSGDEIEMEVPHFDISLPHPEPELFPDNFFDMPDEEEETETDNEDNATTETDFQEDSLSEEEPSLVEEELSGESEPSFMEEEPSFVEEEPSFMEEEPSSVEEEQPESFDQWKDDIHEEELEDTDSEVQPQDSDFQFQEPEPQTPDFPYEPVVFGSMDEKDDGDFELETLGEKMMHEDNSLAAKFQNKPVTDLRTAIGINDKFLLVNELFWGSMEKYNKSIENLNDLKTLDGALVYMNELRVELQWNSNNEAYKKLLDLVHHKFE